MQHSTNLNLFWQNPAMQSADAEGDPVWQQVNIQYNGLKAYISAKDGDLKTLQKLRALADGKIKGRKNSLLKEKIGWSWQDESTKTFLIITCHDNQISPDTFKNQIEDLKVFKQANRSSFSNIPHTQSTSTNQQTDLTKLSSISDETIVRIVKPGSLTEFIKFDTKDDYRATVTLVSPSKTPSTDIEELSRYPARLTKRLGNRKFTSSLEGKINRKVNKSEGRLIINLKKDASDITAEKFKKEVVELMLTRDATFRLLDETDLLMEEIINDQPEDVVNLIDATPPALSSTTTTTTTSSLSASVLPDNLSNQNNDDIAVWNSKNNFFDLTGGNSLTNENEKLTQAEKNAATAQPSIATKKPSVSPEVQIVMTMPMWMGVFVATPAPSPSVAQVNLPAQHLSEIEPQRIVVNNEKRKRKTQQNDNINTIELDQNPPTLSPKRNHRG